MSFVDPTSLEDEIEFDQDLPLVKSLQDLTIVESWSDGKLKFTTFYHFMDDEKIFFCYTSNYKGEMTIGQFNSSPRRFQDQNIYPEIPVNAHLTLTL
ncbi:hypothetical protein N7537_008526 [Penicillium hordei]|uniref:Uncharacterized protein n=1 Tax=Penicillium hordei TaxID=40994 RepID=A0AAD6GZN3_9EURO|nr:uncharacterized protein N7537_008526 [Penicillium hordei]KAJ5598442.1 hypothetical protein N7537_008526 [Penicillium hordei]